LNWVSAAEGQRFAALVTQFTELVQSLGPLDAKERRSELDAVHRTLETETVRWLLGMQRQLTEKGNVYDLKLDPESYRTLVAETVLREYHQNLIHGSLQKGPLTPREINTRTGIGIQNVASLLVEMQERGLVEFAGHEGQSPKFAGIYG
jgi:predicted Rossmann fold nucleotide-binding protein DprA/Smf involved in DNA uptake